MSKLVIKAAYLALGGTDYSAQVKSVELSIDAPEVETTNMASAGWTEVLQGIRKASLNIEFVMDSDLSGIEATVYAAFIHATTNTLTFEVRESSASVGATNPKFTGTVLLTKPLALKLGVGEALTASVNWPVTGAVTRATS